MNGLNGGGIAGAGQAPLAVNMPAKVVLDEKSGTVVVGQDVEVGDVAVSYADITLQIRRTPAQNGGASILGKNTNINELLSALSSVGFSPQDLVAIFKTLHSSGALNAELVVL